MLQEWLSWPPFCVANCQLYGSATFEAGSLFDLIVKSFVGWRLSCRAYFSVSLHCPGK